MSGMCDPETSLNKPLILNLLQPSQPGTLLGDLDQQPWTGTAPQNAKPASIMGQSGAVCHETVMLSVSSQTAAFLPRCSLFSAFLDIIYVIRTARLP
jgi:hypothetical protein